MSVRTTSVLAMVHEKHRGSLSVRQNPHLVNLTTRPAGRLLLLCGPVVVSIAKSYSTCRIRYFKFRAKSVSRDASVLWPFVMGKEAAHHMKESTHVTLHYDLVKLSHYRPLGLQGVEAPRFSRQSAHEGGNVYYDLILTLLSAAVMAQSV